jgi:hypothetical protein
MKLGDLIEQYLKAREAVADARLGYEWQHEERLERAKQALNRWGEELPLE